MLNIFNKLCSPSNDYDNQVMTVIASPGQGPDRSTEVSYTDTKVIVRSLLVPSFDCFVPSILCYFVQFFRTFFCLFVYLFRNCCSVCWLLRSFVLLLFRLFVPLFVPSFFCCLVCLCRCSFVSSFVVSFVCAVVRSFLRSVRQSFILKFIQIIIYSFTHVLAFCFYNYFTPLVDVIVYCLILTIICIFNSDSSDQKKQ